MGCIYSNYKGNCDFFSDEDSDMRPEGCDDIGCCTAEEDPNPDWCGSYESDYICHECGTDLNVEDVCECDE